MKLYPCVLLGDMGCEFLADTVTSAQKGRWYTTDNTNFAPTFSMSQTMWDRKSLAIATNASTGSGDKVLRGVSGTDVDEDDVLNSFGATVDDFTWCQRLGSWMYHTDNYYSGGDPDQFQMVITNNGGTDIAVNWTSAMAAADRWYWISGTPATGTFSSNGADIEQFGFQATAAFTASSSFYLGGFVAYRTVMSTDSNDFNFYNGLDLWASSSFIPTGWNSWRVSGNIMGPRLVDKERQLHSMETLGLSVLDIVRRPSPKYQAMRDCDRIKTYLMFNEGTQGASTKSVEVAIPIIITDVTTEWVAPSKPLIAFEFTAHRFAGV